MSRCLLSFLPYHLTADQRLKDVCVCVGWSGGLHSSDPEFLSTVRLKPSVGRKRKAWWKQRKKYFRDLIANLTK